MSPPYPPSLTHLASAQDESTARVGVVMLRFNGPAENLERAVRSIVTDHQDRGVVAEILLVDNASTLERGSVERVAEKLIDGVGSVAVSTMVLETNLGFSGAVNRAVAALSPLVDQVLLLNDDASLHPGALTTLSKALTNEPLNTVSVAPKLYLDAYPGVLESIGMVVNERGEARNIGLGQFDVGQFDEPMTVLGPTFAAALIRRSAFAPEHVGPLASEYFLYYEDVEWNWRAALLGFRSITVPTATGFHAVSGSSRTDDESSYGFKHRYIEANLLQTVGRLFERPRATRIWLHRWPRLVKARVTGRFPTATFGAAVDAARALPRTVRVRRALQSRRAVPDAAILDLEALHLRSLYDPVSYEPDFTWNAFHDTLQNARERSEPGAASAERFDLLLQAASQQDATTTIEAFGRDGQLHEAFSHYVRRLAPK